MKVNKIVYNFLKIICKPLFKILFRPKVYGKENIPNNGGLIFAGNHKHALDPVLVIINTKRFVHFMAKEEVSKGLHGKLFDLIGIIRVYKDRNKNITSVIEAQNLLQTGGTLGIFPEGTRNKTKEVLQNFKTGTVIMAQKTKSQILPFAIRGNYKLFRKGLEIEYGKPIDVSNLDIQDANNYLKNEVLKLLMKN